MEHLASSGTIEFSIATKVLLGEGDLADLRLKSARRLAENAAVLAAQLDDNVAVLNVDAELEDENSGRLTPAPSDPSPAPHVLRREPHAEHGPAHVLQHHEDVLAGPAWAVVSMSSSPSRSHTIQAVTSIGGRAAV